MFQLATHILPSLVTLNFPPGRRTGLIREFEELEICFQINLVSQTIHAQIAGIAWPLLIYDTRDFLAVITDLPEQHVERVRQFLGTDPETVLQALIDGTDLPPMPARVPREVPNWRVKVILSSMGMLDRVDAFIDSLPEPQRAVAFHAWNGDARISRKSATVAALASAMQLTDEQLDAMFMQAEALEI